MAAQNLAYGLEDRTASYEALGTSLMDRASFFLRWPPISFLFNVLRGEPGRGRSDRFRRLGTDGVTP